MKLHPYRTELFRDEPIPTEQGAYEELQRAPLAADVNYFAAPWSVLIKHKLLQTPDVRLSGGFTVCQHVYFWKMIPLCRKIGLDTVFCPHAPRPVSNHLGAVVSRAGRFLGAHRMTAGWSNNIGGIRVLPFPLFAVNGIAPATNKDLWYSFIGFQTHRVRKPIFALGKRPDTVIQRRDHWHFNVDGDRQQDWKREYQDVLARSRFSLCPRGVGTNTLRFWESLQAGAIPVLFSDDLALPAGVDWDSCVIRIPERRAADVEQVLAGISPEAEARMRAACLKTHQQFCGPNLVSTIRDHYRPLSKAA